MHLGYKLLPVPSVHLFPSTASLLHNTALVRLPYRVVVCQQSAVPRAEWRGGIWRRKVFPVALSFTRKLNPVCEEVSRLLKSTNLAFYFFSIIFRSPARAWVIRGG